MIDDAIPKAGAEIGHTAGALAAAGVTMLPSQGRKVYRNQWVIIGTIVIAAADGIEVGPRSDLVRAQLDRLVEAAMLVRRFGKRSMQGWEWFPTRGWVVLVGMRYLTSPSPWGVSGSSAMSSGDGVKPLVLDGFSLPSGR